VERANPGEILLPILRNGQIREKYCFPFCGKGKPDVNHPSGINYLENGSYEANYALN
jgi:hypothetical protein